MRVIQSPRNNTPCLRFTKNGKAARKVGLTLHERCVLGKPLRKLTVTTNIENIRPSLCFLDDSAMMMLCKYCKNLDFGDVFEDGYDHQPGRAKTRRMSRWRLWALSTLLSLCRRTRPTRNWKLKWSRRKTIDLYKSFLQVSLVEVEVVSSFQLLFRSLVTRLFWNRATGNSYHWRSPDLLCDIHQANH